jgi:hypothetical protein
MKPTIKACPVTLPELKSDGPTSSSVLWFARSAVPVRATRVIKTRPLFSVILRRSCVTREELMIERDSVRVQISLTADKGLSTASLEQRLAEIEQRMSACNVLEPMQFAARRKARQRKR